MVGQPRSRSRKMANEGNVRTENKPCKEILLMIE